MESKLLDLEDGEYLVKGMPCSQDSTLAGYYRVEKSGMDQEEKRAISREAVKYGTFWNISLDNFLDMQLMLQLSTAADNTVEKNMYYIIHTDESPAYTTLLPWDTDMSFGLNWSFEDNAIRYMPEKSTEQMLERIEYEEMKKKYPELDSLLSQRWAELRSGPFSEEKLEKNAEYLYKQLSDSGAYIRDSERWGLFSGGEDTYENLLEFMRGRLKVLDAYYAE